ncbi:MAG: phage tail length tape measure family protein [Reyranella sp.]
MAAAAFKVQGELVLDNAGFVPAAQQSKTALEGVSTAGRKVAEASTAMAAATAQATQAQVASANATKSQADGFARLAQQQAAAVNTAKSQADGFARLAQQQAADAGKAQSQALMSSVAQSNEQLQALYGTATKAQTVELGKATKATKEYEAAQINARAANDNAAVSLDKQTRALTYQRVQLGYQLNDVFVQLASGQGVFRTAIQQGPQITQLYGGLGNALRAIPLAAAGYVAAIGAVVGVTLAAVNQVSEFSARNRQSEISLQATGRAAQVTAAQIEEMVRAEARRPGADRAETQQSAQLLLANNAITGQAVQQTLSLARDLARVTGTDLPTATAALSQGLDGTLAGARKLDAAFNVLTPSELAQIQRFEQMGQRAQAVAVVLAALERNLGGANERGVSPLERASTQLRTSWNNLLDSLSKTGVITVAANAVSLLAQPLILAAKAADLLSQVGGSGGASAGPSADDIAKAQRSVEVERLNLAQLKADRAKATADEQYQYDQAILASQRRLKDGEANLAQLQGQTAATTQKTLQDQVQGWATALNNQVKEAVAANDKIETVTKRQQDLLAARTNALTIINSGIASPSQVAQASESLTIIEGQLRALRTPAQELQRQLDLGTTLSQVPAHLRPAAQAFQETKQRALEMGMSVAEAERMAGQARDNVLREAGTATQNQIQLLSEEAAAALKVADAYGVSRAQALQLAAQQKAAAAELQGSIAPGTAAEFAQRTLEEQAASSIAASAEKNEAYGREVRALERLVEAEGRSSAAAREAERANRVAAYAEDLRAQAAATGSATIIAAAERQIATYDRLSKAAMQAEIRRDANALNRQYDPSVAYDQEMAKLAELQAAGLLTRQTIEDYTKQAEMRRLEASRSATDGMIAGLRRYADEATNAGQAAAQGMSAGLRTIEDTLVQVATTGKFSFSNMVNSMIADLVRLSVRQGITGPIASALGGINWGSLLGGGSSIPTIGTGTGMTYHRGGIVGRDGTPRSGISSDVWDNAPRYHKGGLVAGERAIIAQDGEEVLTTDNPRHRWNVASASGAGSEDGRGTVRFGLDVRVFTSGNGNVRAEQGVGSDGMPTLDIVFDEGERRLAGKIMNTTGPLYKAFAATFGARQVART